MDSINKRYTILKRLDEGGMGEIYLVGDRLNNNHTLALKKIKKDCVNDRTLQGFKHEFEVMTRLRHPNLIRVYDFGRDYVTGEYYITMEYLSGYSLKHILDHDYKPDRDTIIAIMIDACRATAFIHTRNILHRDIKPGNVFITTHTSMPDTDHTDTGIKLPDNGRIKLMDFGLADLLEPEVQTSAQSKGTLTYFAPEVLKKKADKRSDIYALGVTFYELLCGRTFYADYSSHQIVSALLHKKNLVGIRRDALEKLNDPATVQIIKKMTAYNPDDRYSSCSQIIADINRLMGKSYTPETPETREAYILGAGFVGRTHELTCLKNHLTRKNTHHKALWLEGEAGVGKSRLFLEFKKYCQLNTIAYFEGTCHKDRYLSPLLPILDELLLESGDELIARYGPELVKVLKYHPCLKQITPSAHQEPQAEQSRLIKTIAAFIINTCNTKQGTTALYINDVHAIDITSLKIIDEIIHSSLPTTNLALFLSSRKEGREFLDIMQSKDAIHILHLSPFDDKTVVNYIEAIFGKDTIGKKFRRAIPAIKQKVGGNPFYLQELIKSIVETGKLDYPESSWELLLEFADIQIPDTISDLVSSRLERLKLSPEHRKALEVLSLLNREINYPELNRIIPFDLDLLAHLTDNEIITGSIGETGIEYTLAHDLITETVTGGIIHKSTLHELIANRLELLHRDEPEAYIDEIAEHYFNTANTDKAQIYLEKAGNRAIDNYENNKALNLLDKLLSLLDDDHEVIKIDALIHKGKVLELLGDYEGSRDILLIAERLAEEIGDKSRCAKANNQLFLAYDMLEDCFQPAIKAADKALHLYRELGDRPGECAMLSALGTTYTWFDQDRGLAYLEEGLQLALKNDFKTTIARNYDYLSRLYWRRGNNEKAIDYMNAAIKINDEIENKRYLSIGYALLGRYYCDGKAYEKAMHCQKQSKLVAEEIEFSAVIVLSLLFMTELYIIQNNINAAKITFNQARAHLATNHIDEYYILSKIFESRIEAACGNNAKAVEILMGMLDAGENTEKIDYLTEVNYELWTLTGEEQYRTESLKINEEREQKSPSFYFRKRINDLKGPPDNHNGHQGRYSYM